MPFCLELLAGLEPATYCHPKKMRDREHDKQGTPFFGDPEEIIFGLTGSNATHKPKQKSIRKGCFFVWSYWPDLNRRPADYEAPIHQYIGVIYTK